MKVAINQVAHFSESNVDVKAGSVVQLELNTEPPVKGFVMEVCDEFLRLRHSATGFPIQVFYTEITGVTLVNPVLRTLPLSANCANCQVPMRLDIMSDGVTPVDIETLFVHAEMTCDVCGTNHTINFELEEELEEDDEE